MKKNVKLITSILHAQYKIHKIRDINIIIYHIYLHIFIFVGNILYVFNTAHVKLMY
jgi:hypothetical protein